MNDIKNTLSLWSLGAGNSAKRFHGEDPMPEKREVATASSWTTNPMPDAHETIDMDVHLSGEALDMIRYGHIPEAMEDHWFMYCDEDTIHYYRSWTGFCIYEANYRMDGGDAHIFRLMANRDKEQYGCTSMEKDKALFMFLLCSETGTDGSSFWEAYCRAE